MLFQIQRIYTVADGPVNVRPVFLDRAVIEAESPVNALSFALRLEACPPHCVCVSPILGTKGDNKC